jgi:plasmid stabilization system protein ParE
MKVRLHPAAREELRGARLWYEEQSPLSAVAFIEEVDAAVSRIAYAPLLYPLVGHGTRRLVLRRFPFNVLYRIGNDEVVIIALAHQKRIPFYWSGR